MRVCGKEREENGMDSGRNWRHMRWFLNADVLWRHWIRLGLGKAICSLFIFSAKRTDRGP